MMTDYQKIRNTIEKYLSEHRGGCKFIIYPFGEYGMLTKRILNEAFGIREYYIVDNKLSKYNLNIKDLNYFRNKDVSEYTVLVTNVNTDTYDEVRKLLLDIFDYSNVLDIFPRLETESRPKCGKYSYGPLCKNKLVESIGAFSSFAPGTQVVVNHPIHALSTHPFLYWDIPGDSCFFSDVVHRPEIRKIKKVKIGSDVWLGYNVIITNGSDIGNGVIAAAGAIITKDVPDYAVVAGVPARIIRYRYTAERIAALNKIAWWNWPDEKIRKYYDDFFEDVDVFINKHGNKDNK